MLVLDLLGKGQSHMICRDIFLYAHVCLWVCILAMCPDTDYPLCYLWVSGHLCEIVLAHLLIPTLLRSLPEWCRGKVAARKWGAGAGGGKGAGGNETTARGLGEQGKREAHGRMPQGGAEAIRGGVGQEKTRRPSCQFCLSL